MKKGFTFIELLLYVAIVGTIFSSLVPFAWNVIEGGARSSVDQEVDSNARFIMEKIKSKTRNAKNISVAMTSLTITEQDLSTTTIDLSGGNIRLNAVNLNSADTTVTDLVFTDFSSGSTTKQVQVRFTLTSAVAQARQEYRQTVTLESSAEVRAI